MAEPRHQLLAERGRQGQAAAVLDQQLPAGDRREDRQVDPDVRQRTALVNLRDGLARARGHGLGVASRQPRQGLEEPDHPRARRRARRSSRRRATSAPTTSSPASSSGSSTRFRSPASSATRRGRRTRYKYVGGANNWGSMSVDDERGIVYVPTGSADLRLLRRGSPRREPVRATACSRSTRGRASGCGTSRRSITICGTSTTCRRRSSSPCVTTAAASTPWRTPARPASSTSSIA